MSKQFINIKEIEEYLSGVFWIIETFEKLSNNKNYEEIEYYIKLSEVLGELENENIQSEDVEKVMKNLSKKN